ncbi:MAG: DPP IV N-terminal domain-containing protein, partial [Muribaculaceae bacterium]
MIEMKLLTKLMIGVVVALCGFVAVAQERLPEYLQAEKFTKDKLNTMLFSTTVRPNWMAKGSSFWYEYKTSEGNFWWVVNPVTRSKTPLWDRDKLAAELTTIVHDPFEARHLPIQNLKALKDGETFSFEIVSTKDVEKPKKDDKEGEKKGKKRSKGGKKRFFFEWNFATQTLKHLADKEEAEEESADWANVSPDKSTVVFAKDCNLYRMSYADYKKALEDENDSTIVEIQLTTDGTKDFGYGIPYSLLNTDTLCNGKRRGAWGAWSPDSRHFATIIEDNSAVKELWVINSVASPRPTLETYKYQMPGEMEAPIEHLYVFDMTNNTRKEVNTARFKHQTHNLEYAPRDKRMAWDANQATVWLGDNKHFYLNRSSRDLHRIDVCSYTIGEDTIVPLIEERMNTYQELRRLHVVNGGQELIHWSERDGWAHLYLYDGTGKLKNRITQGSWHVEDVVKVDERTRTIYFSACGREDGENPYYEHLYSVRFDGTGLRMLTPGDFFHAAMMDQDARFVVDNYSRVNTVPRTDLRDALGNKIMTLEEADFSQLLANGYQFPEPFKVKAADGVTDLYGVMFKPFDMDTTKTYPIVDYVYPGPQVEAVYYPFTRMTVRTDRLAQAGFVVISVGQRGGHPNRSKWYHNFGYGNMRDYPLADHKYAIEQLANRHKWIDINRVGIHGHSGGGFMSTAAICQYPDFFKAAVSCAGNHDNNIYNRWWSETHHGVKEKVNEEGDTTFVYQIATNPEIASKLKGHLMLVHGDIDNNVHPANTTRVADALIRAGKRFDMLYLPQQRHGFGNMDEYFYWRMVDFFSEHLKGRSEHSV